MDDETRIEIAGLNAKVYGLAELISTLQSLAAQHHDRIKDLEHIPRK